MPNTTDIMKTSSKIIIGYMASLTLLSIVLIAVMQVRHRDQRPHIKSLFEQIASDSIRVVSITCEKNENIYVQSSSREKYLNFYTVPDSVYMQADTLFVRNQPNGLNLTIPNLQSVLVNGTSIPFEQVPELIHD